MEKALGRALPQMEVRFKDASISADIVFKDETDIKVELPTLTDEHMKSVRGMGAKKHTVKKQILKNISGVFKPGTITLSYWVSRDPRSVPHRQEHHRGRRRDLQWRTGQRIAPASATVVSYVTQRDEHYPSLTVKETLEFAHACCGGGFSERDAQHFAGGTPEENKAAPDAVRAMFEHYPDVVIQQLGLDNCQNTIIGDAMTRGVSGAEHKRVTTGEMEFGNKYVRMMDEISTGLDSATIFDIITTQHRQEVPQDGGDLVVTAVSRCGNLNEGHVICYHGPRALGYFENLGFKCPPRRDVAVGSRNR